MAWTQIERLVVFREKHKNVLQRIAVELLGAPLALEEVAAGITELQPEADRSDLAQKFETYIVGYFQEWPAQETPDRLFDIGRMMAQTGVSRPALALGLGRLRRRIIEMLSAGTLEDDTFLEAVLAVTMAEDLVLTGCRVPDASEPGQTVIAPGTLDVPRLIRYVTMLSSLREAQDAMAEGNLDSARQKLQAVTDLNPHDPGVMRQLKWLNQCADALDASARLSEVRRIAEQGDPEKALSMIRQRTEPERRGGYVGMAGLARREEAAGFSVTELHAQAMLAMEAGDYDEAQNLLDRASGINDKVETTLDLKNRLKSLRKSADARILLDEAANYIANHHLDDARERLDKVRQIDPGNPRLTAMLKQVDARTGKPESSAYDEALAALEKSDIELATTRLRSLMANAADPVLIKSLRSKIDEARRNKQIHDLQVEAERMIVDGDYENAARRLLQARSLNAERPDTLELIDKLAKLSRLRGSRGIQSEAQTALERGDFKTAEAKVRQGLAAEPHNSDLLRIQHKLHQAMGRPKPEAEQLIANGKKALEAGNVAEAMYILQQASAIDPENTEAKALLKDARERMSAGETLSFGNSAITEPMSGVMRVSTTGTQHHDDKEQSGIGPALISIEPADMLREIEDARIQARQNSALPPDFEYPLDDDEESSGVTSTPGSPDDSGIKTALPRKPRARSVVGGMLYHWMVTSHIDVPPETHFRYAMDSAVNFNGLAISRDVLFLDPAHFGVFPQRGPHEMFYRHGGYSQWRDRLKEWLHLHESRMRKHLSRLLPKDMPADKLPRFGVLGRLGWQASYETTPNTPSDKVSALANDSDYQDDWEEFVRAINKRWDADFMALIQTEVPDKTDGFDDLSIGGQRRRFARKKILSDSWDHFSKILFLFTLKTCKTLYPTIQWGYMGYPANLSISDPTDVRAKMIYHQGMNDKMEWLYRAVDLIIPRYPTRHVTVPDSAKVTESSRQNTVNQDIKSVEYNVGEAIRLRNAFAPDRPVIIANSFTYAGSRNQPLNEINMEHNFRLPVLLGVDGVFIHGQIESTADREFVQSEINGKLGGAIKRALEQSRRRKPD